MKTIIKYSSIVILLFFTFFTSCSEEKKGEDTDSDKFSNSEIEVFQASIPIESDIPAKISFISSRVGNTVSKIFTIKNTGFTSLAVSNLIVTSGFSIVKTPKSSVAPDESVTFEIRFNALTVGEKTGKISFNTNDDDEGLFTINIVGETLVPSKAEIELTESQVILTNDPTVTVNFGNTPQNSVVIKTFTVKNIALDDPSTSLDNLTLSNLAVTSGYSIVSNFGSTTIAPSGSTTFQIKFDALTLGQVPGELTFTTNDSSKGDSDPDESSIKVNFVANTTANYFPSKNGNSWFYDRQFPASSTSTSQISSNELTEPKNIFGKYFTESIINKNVYNYLLDGMIEFQNIGSVSVNNLIFFNEKDPVNKIYSYAFTFEPDSFDSEDIDFGGGRVLKDVVITTRPRLFIDIRKLTNDENYTVNSVLYPNTQNTQWDLSISSTATISGNLWNGATNTGNVSQSFELVKKATVGYNQVRLARDVGPIETIQNIDFKNLTFIKKFNFFGSSYDATDQITPIEAEFRANNDLNYSKLKSAIISN